MMILLTAVVLVVSGVFIGATWGVHVGRNEGLASARTVTQEHWVDMLEVSVNLQRSRLGQDNPTPPVI
ncbi:MAG: hypothetical protein WD029_01785 [Microthrixaceae bacterium]